MIELSHSDKITYKVPALPNKTLNYKFSFLDSKWKFMKAKDLKCKLTNENNSKDVDKELKSLESPRTVSSNCGLINKIEKLSIDERILLSLENELSKALNIPKDKLGIKRDLDTENMDANIIANDNDPLNPHNNDEVGVIKNGDNKHNNNNSIKFLNGLEIDSIDEDCSTGTELNDEIELFENSTNKLIQESYRNVQIFRNRFENVEPLRLNVDDTSVLFLTSNNTLKVIKANDQASEDIVSEEIIVPNALKSTRKRHDTKLDFSKLIDSHIESSNKTINKPKVPSTSRPSQINKSIRMTNALRSSMTARDAGDNNRSTNHNKEMMNNKIANELLRIKNKKTDYKKKFNEKVTNIEIAKHFKLYLKEKDVRIPKFLENVNTNIKNEDFNPNNSIETSLS